MNQETTHTLIQALCASEGNVTKACKAVGITRRAYEQLLRDDADFQQQVAEIEDEIMDNVEGCLMEQIAQGNRTATMFYLRTKGRRRGWSEKPTPPTGCATTADLTEHEQQVAEAEERIRQQLRDIDKHAAPQLIRASALIVVEVERLAAALATDGPTIVEYSREGFPRQIVNPKFGALLSAAKQINANFTALGLVGPSAEPDGLDDLLNKLIAPDDDSPSDAF